MALSAIARRWSCFTLLILAPVSLVQADTPPVGSAESAENAPPPPPLGASAEAGIRRAMIQSKVDLEVAGNRPLAHAKPANDPKPTAAGQSEIGSFRVKFETELGLKPGTIAKIEAELEREATPAQYADVEACLNSHPGVVLKYADKAYQDDKLTVFECEVVKGLKERSEIDAAKSRIKAKLDRLRKASR